MSDPVPGDIGRLRRKALRHQNRGEAWEECRALRKLLRLAPADVAAAEHLERLYRSTSQLETALAMWRRILDVAPTNEVAQEHVIDLDRTIAHITEMEEAAAAKLPSRASVKQRPKRMGAKPGGEHVDLWIAELRNAHTDEDALAAHWALNDALVDKSYYHSAHWQTLTAQAKWDADYRCLDCDKRRQLDVHHLTYDRLGEEPPDDLRVVCRDCHGTYHGGGGVEYPPVW